MSEEDKGTEIVKTSNDQGVDLQRLVMRPSLKRFAEFQEKVLRENDHKPSWANLNIGNKLLPMLRAELVELEEAFEKSYHVKGKRHVQKECADLANFAMMIYDILENFINLDA